MRFLLQVPVQSGRLTFEARLSRLPEQTRPLVASRPRPVQLLEDLFVTHHNTVQTGWTCASVKHDSVDVEGTEPSYIPSLCSSPGGSVPDNDFLSFSLPDEFVDDYQDRDVDWGFDIGGGNTLGEVTFITKYSLLRDDGTKERWPDVCRRVTEGYWSIIKDHQLSNTNEFFHYMAHKSAKDAFERMFNFKWSPPGRGLWKMGTSFVNGQGNSAALQNCAFVSTEKLSPHSAREATLPFVRLMEMSMLGVGVGFDTRGAGNLEIRQPNADETATFVIEDTREGWYQSVAALLESYFFKGRPTVEFDYSLIRPAGEPIRGFGGVAAGPAPLERLHRDLRVVFDGRAGETITSTDIVDVMNMIGLCVVSGNVRRSAEIALGDPNDDEFLQLKDWNVNPERMAIADPENGVEGGWGHVSNNSVVAEVGQSLTDSHIVDSIQVNGEPGIFWLDLARSHGRLADPPNDKDSRVMGCNPCGEQSLESYECCTLVEVFLPRHDDLDDFKETLKHAYLYGKAVTLMPTHWPEVNSVMQRNRRIGCSITGVAQFVEEHGWAELERWMDEGYKMIQERDEIYSDWLGVRESIKTTSVKPSGTVSLLAGCTPGVHWPTATTYIRRQRLPNDDPVLEFLREAGYKTEKDAKEPSTTTVVEFPTVGPQVRTEREVSIWEKAALAAKVQKWWADNQVSVTVTFRPDEQDQIGPLLSAYNGELKSVSMLPLGDDVGVYKQMPYEPISDRKLTAQHKRVSRLDVDAMYSGGYHADAVGELYCTTDKCELPDAA